MNAARNTPGSQSHCGLPDGYAADGEWYEAMIYKNSGTCRAANGLWMGPGSCVCPEWCAV